MPVRYCKLIESPSKTDYSSYRPISRVVIGREVDYRS